MEPKEQVTSDLITIWALMMHRQYGHFERGAEHMPSSKLNPSKGRGRILSLLQLKDGIKTKDLAKILDIRVSSLNELLAKMEAAGLIERRQSEADKRVMLIYLTEKGANAELEEEPDEIDLFKGFTDAEIEQLSGYTNRLVENAESGFDPEEIERMREAREERAKAFGEWQGSSRDGRNRRDGPFGRSPFGFGGFGFDGARRFPF
ncbi:MAG: MarR family winged helix-turn-helix transcriptional regulator [Eggerthellaceae bacterium]|jgi:DNA-binding MarR family transcriptional regulator